MTAAYEGHSDIVQKLLDYDVDPDVVKNRGRSALFFAAQGGYMKALQAILSSGRANINLTDKNQLSPLHLASLGRSNEVVAFLIGKGANIDAVDDSGNAPLSFACRIGNVDIVRTFLQAGAAVDLPDDTLWTPLHLVLQEVKPETHEIVKLLLEYGANVNVRTDGGSMPPHIAAQEGDFDILRDLIAKGADINAEMSKGTPLMRAVVNGHVDAVEFLCENGANTSFSKTLGTSALHLALARNPNYDIVHKLIKMGADVNAMDNNDDTPLALAVSEDNLELVELLLDDGAEHGNVELYITGIVEWEC